MKKTAAVVLSLLAFAIVARGDAGPDGAALFKSRCAMCHGPDGKGNTPVGKSMKVRDLSTREVQKQTDEALSRTIADGKGKMPSFKAGLDRRQIAAVVSFVRALKR